MNHMLAPAVFLEDPERLDVHLYEGKSEKPILLHVDRDRLHDTVITLHMTPECASKISAELMSRVTGHGVCADCGIYKPLSGDIHCIDCDKKLERAHEAEER